MKRLGIPLGTVVVAALLVMGATETIPQQAAAAPTVVTLETDPAICAEGEATLIAAWERVARARQALRRAHGTRFARIKREIWERDKEQALEIEEQQRALCG